VDRVNWTTRALAATSAIGTLGTAVTFLFLHQSHEVPKLKKPAVGPPPPPLVKENVAIGRGDTLDDLLDRAGIDAASRVRMISEVRNVFDVRKFRAGSYLTLARSTPTSVESLEYVIDPDHKLRLSRSRESYRAAVEDIPGTVRTVPVCGTLQDSLFGSMERAGERPELAIRVAEIFAWDLDFYTDPQEGDEFCVVLEKKEYSNGQPSTYGRILAARYKNGDHVYEGWLFPGDEGRPHYYSRDGRSLESAFLRSPMKFDARISSGFSRHRFHPVLRIYRPHLGTDYAAPTGSPVQAIASGRVTFSGRSGGSGNMVRIEHANGYESLYLHLSRMYVRRGAHVEQGQLIGAVGSTGLATGPHLDFRMRRNGAYVNFQKLSPPRATQLDARQMQAFAAERDRYAALMDSGVQSAALEHVD
jgi:murein DD-endopeptidase MepM/ murein hydrolase activator NlpD